MIYFRIINPYKYQDFVYYYKFEVNSRYLNVCLKNTYFKIDAKKINTFNRVKNIIKEKKEDILCENEILISVLSKNDSKAIEDYLLTIDFY